MAETTKRISGSLLASQSNTAVAGAEGVSNRRLRCIAMSAMVADATTLKLEDTAGNDLTGTYDFAANGGIVEAANPYGWWETAEGEGVRYDSGTNPIDMFKLTLIEV